MKNLRMKFVLASTLTLAIMGHVELVQTAWADDLKNLREELDYSPQARAERQEAEDRNTQFIHYQQQEYMEQQKRLFQEDMYNQTHPCINKQSAYQSFPE